MGRKPGLGRAESEILRYIADHHPITVREVGEHLAQTKGQTRTTALNMMERLREKGYLARELVEGIYRYSLVQPKAGMMRGIVRDFVSQMLGGSLEPFAAYLAEEAALTDAEVTRLKEAIAALERREAEAESKEEEGEK